MNDRHRGLIDNLARRNISAFYCNNAQGVQKKVLELIPVGASVGFSGSKTIQELNLIEIIKNQGVEVFDQYGLGVDKEEGMRLRQLGIGADYYLTSVNAVTWAGELVFLSAFGHRSAGIANAKNLIIMCGINKITDDLNTALSRAREYVAPLNCKRLNWHSVCLDKGICQEDVCFPPQYKRMCCQTLIIEAEMNPGRVKFILCQESLGI